MLTADPHNTRVSASIEEPVMSVQAMSRLGAGWGRLEGSSDSSPCASNRIPLSAPQLDTRRPTKQ